MPALRGDAEIVRDAVQAVRRHEWLARTLACGAYGVAIATPIALAAGLVHVLLTPLPAVLVTAAAIGVVLCGVLAGALRPPAPRAAAAALDRRVGADALYASACDVIVSGCAGHRREVADIVIAQAASRVAADLRDPAAKPALHIPALASWTAPVLLSGLFLLALGGAPAAPGSGTAATASKARAGAQIERRDEESGELTAAASGASARPRTTGPNEAAGPQTAAVSDTPDGDARAQDGTVSQPADGDLAGDGQSQREAADRQASAQNPLQATTFVDIARTSDALAAGIHTPGKPSGAIDEPRVRPAGPLASAVAARAPRLAPEHDYPPALRAYAERIERAREPPR